MQIDFGPLFAALITVGLKLVAALIIFAVGRWLANVLARLVRRALDQRETDEAVARMLSTLTRLAVLITAVAIALGAWAYRLRPWLRWSPPSVWPLAWRCKARWLTSRAVC